MTNDDKDNAENSKKGRELLSAEAFDTPDDVQKDSISGELVGSAVTPVVSGGRVTNFFAQALSFSRRLTSDIKRLELASLGNLLRERKFLQSQIIDSTKFDARFEQVDKILDAERDKVVTQLHTEYLEDMDKLDERASQMVRDQQSRVAEDALLGYGPEGV